MGSTRTVGTTTGMGISPALPPNMAPYQTRRVVEVHVCSFASRSRCLSRSVVVLAHFRDLLEVDHKRLLCFSFTPQQQAPSQHQKSPSALQLTSFSPQVIYINKETVHHDDKQGQSHRCFCAFPRFPALVLTVLELRTPTKSILSGYISSTPFAVLDVRSNGSGSSCSPSSSSGSISQSGAAFATPSRGFVLGDPPSIRQHLVSKRSFSVPLRTRR